MSAESPSSNLSLTTAELHEILDGLREPGFEYDPLESSESNEPLGFNELNEWQYKLSLPLGGHRSNEQQTASEEGTASTSMEIIRGLHL